jgi:hypothetical protein
MDIVAIGTLARVVRIIQANRVQVFGYPFISRRRVDLVDHLNRRRLYGHQDQAVLRSSLESFLSVPGTVSYYSCRSWHTSFVIDWMLPADHLESGSDDELATQLVENASQLWRHNMAKLKSETRKRLPAKAFAEPEKKKYPIEDKAHARNALSRVDQSGTPAEKTKVKRAVRKKYPSIGKKSS